jgi:hypothetical protein
MGVVVHVHVMSMMNIHLYRHNAHTHTHTHTTFAVLHSCSDTKSNSSLEESLQAERPALQARRERVEALEESKGVNARACVYVGISRCRYLCMFLVVVMCFKRTHMTHYTYVNHYPLTTLAPHYTTLHYTTLYHTSRLCRIHSTGLSLDHSNSLR